MEPGMQRRSFSRIDMDCGLVKSVPYAGHRSICNTVAYTLIKVRAARRVFILTWTWTQGLATTPTGIAVCICYRERDASSASLVFANDSTNWRISEAGISSSSAHAEAFNGIQTRQPGGRYRITCSLSRASQSAINSTLHGVSAGSVQRVLEGLEFCESPWRKVLRDQLQGLFSPQQVCPRNPLGCPEDNLSGRHWLCCCGHRSAIVPWLDCGWYWSGLWRGEWG